MDTSDKITLKEWFDRWMEFHQREHRLQVQGVEDKLAERDKALGIQTQETGRRLDHLNNANQIAQQNFDRYVSKDTYGSLEARVNKIEKDLSKEEGKGARSVEFQGQTQWSTGIIVAVILSAGSMVLTVIGFILR